MIFKGKLKFGNSQ